MATWVVLAVPSVCWVGPGVGKFLAFQALLGEWLFALTLTSIAMVSLTQTMRRAPISLRIALLAPVAPHPGLWLWYGYADSRAALVGATLVAMATTAVGHVWARRSTERPMGTVSRWLLSGFLASVRLAFIAHAVHVAIVAWRTGSPRWSIDERLGRLALGVIYDAHLWAFIPVLAVGATILTAGTRVGPPTPRPEPRGTRIARRTIGVMAVATVFGSALALVELYERHTDLVADRHARCLAEAEGLDPESHASYMRHCDR